MKIREIVGRHLRRYPELYKTALLIERIFTFPFRLTTLVFFTIIHSFSKRQNVICRSNASYMGDGFATQNYVSFLHNKKFREAYRKGFDKIDHSGLLRERDTFNIAWRAHIVTWAANQALQVDGDFIECGVWYGVLSKTICEYTVFPDSEKKFYLIDQWGDQTSNILNEKYKIDIFSTVQERFMQYPNVKLIRGSVP